VITFPKWRGIKTVHSLPMAQHPIVGPIIEASQSHSDTPHSVGLLWTSDRSVTGTFIWQHTTSTRDRHPCPRQSSNPQSLQKGDCNPTP